MELQDLLNEISEHKMSTWTDKQCVYFEKTHKYTLEQFLPIWEDHYNNYIGKGNIYKKWGMQQQTFIRWCERYKLPMRSWDEMKNHGVITRNSAKGRDINVQKGKDNPENQDIINGMDCKDWMNKYQKSRQCYHTRKLRLRKKGLVD
jgi:hypothetical protein